MDQTDLDQLEKLLDRTLDRRQHIPAGTHRKHHDYIDSLIAEQETHRARREQWLRVVGGWGIVVTISAVATAIWQFIKHQINGS
ncbi:MAG: hypothetical protein ACR2Q3_01540 [Woeseiaceae bacterium]